LLFDYKSNRSGKNYDFSGVNSEYYNNIDKFMKRVLENKKKTTNQDKISEEQLFFSQKKNIKFILEELFVRQVEVDKCEADDLIAYYILNKKPNDRVIIVSNDMDLAQLISDENYIAQYVIRLKKFITCANFKENFSYNQSNVVIQKILCGDQSDVIYGVKSLGVKTLHNIMPELIDRKVEFYEIIQRVKELKDERGKTKKKPMLVYDNILNQITDGSHQDGKLFEINEKIINLKKPLLTNDAIEEMENIMYSPIDPEGRNMGNLYKLILEYGIDDLIDTNRFSNFFSTFNKTIDKEKKFFNNWKDENSSRS
jgi:5'-3' exonuclease